MQIIEASEVTTTTTASEALCIASLPTGFTALATHFFTPTMSDSHLAPVMHIASHA